MNQDKDVGPINTGNPNEFTIYQLAETVIKLCGSKSKIVKLPLPSDDPKQRRPDITKAIEILGWKPKIELDEGLRKTIDYFKHLDLRRYKKPTPHTAIANTEKVAKMKQITGGPADEEEEETNGTKKRVANDVGSVSKKARKSTA